MPFTFAMLWAVFQTVPFSLPELHHPLWRSASEALGTPYRGSISLDPAASAESLVRIGTWAGIFWLALQFGRERQRAHGALIAVAGATAVYALYGLAVQFSGTNTILWFDKTAYHDVVTATFVNRNSFATFAGLGLVCAAAALRGGVDRTGLGTFASAYRVYRSGRIGPNVERAHNDYLEMTLELGIPAAACFFAALGTLVLVCAFGVFTRRRDAELPAAGAASCTLVGAHAFVDFSLQIPAVAATFALVLGVATAQSWRTDPGSTHGHRP